jgi:hypothetical protein
MATYELGDIGFLNQPTYRQLREHRSPREAGIISRMSVLDRTIYRLIVSQGQFNPEPDSVAITVSLVLHKDASGDLENWYMEVAVHDIFAISFTSDL